MERSVGPVSDRDPALAPAAWGALAGDGVPEEGAAWVLAYGDALANETLVFSVWDRGQLKGVATAVVLAAEKPTLSLELMGGTGSGLRFAPGVDRKSVAAELLAAAIDHCRAHSLPTLVLSHCVADDEPVIAAARELGFRVLPADADYRLDLPEETTYERYLADLGARDRGIFNRNLRRVEEAHAVVAQERPIGAAVLAEAWPQYLEKTERLGSLYRHRANLFDAIRVRYGSAGAELAGTKCVVAGEMVGVFLYLRAGRSAILPYLAHVREPPLQAWAALIVHTMRLLIDQGATRLVLGPSHDQFKGHLGATKIPHVHCFRAIAPA